MNEKLNIIIADDHDLLLDGLQVLIEKHLNINKIFRANNGNKVLEIINNNHIDILISDIEMPELNGIETAVKIKDAHKKIKIIILTSHYGIQHVKPILKLNIKVILDKENVKTELPKAIMALLNDETYYSKLIKKTVEEIIQGKRKTNQKTAIPILTRREKELFPYFAKGMSNKEIAKKVSLSPATIDSHRANIYLKFEVKNAAKFIVKALKFGLIE